MMLIEEKRLLVWESEGGATRRDHAPAMPERRSRNPDGARVHRLLRIDRSDDRDTRRNLTMRGMTIAETTNSRNHDGYDTRQA